MAPITALLVKPYLGELVPGSRPRQAAASGATEPVLRADGLELDLAAHVVRRDGEPAHLTLIEFELLRVLLGNRGRLLTNRALLSAVWGPRYVDDTATLRTHIANLRRKDRAAPALHPHRRGRGLPLRALTWRARASGHYNFSMAAGVGKTYRMLQEGQAEAEAGRDVVIGLLEAHGREETAALASGLEVVPRRRALPGHDARGDGPPRHPLAGPSSASSTSSPTRTPRVWST